MPFESILAWPLLIGASLCLTFLLGLLVPACNCGLALHPRKPYLWQLLSFHWVHGDWRHLLCNLLPLLMLTTLILIQGRQLFLLASACILLTAGIGTWLFSTASRVAGASALVYGYWGFVVSAAAISQQPAWTGTAAISLLFYSGLWATLGRVEQGISWSAHFWGLAGGVGAALLAFTGPGRILPSF